MLPKSGKTSAERCMNRIDKSPEQQGRAIPTDTALSRRDAFRETRENSVVHKRRKLKMVVSHSLKGAAARVIHRCTEISRFMSDGSLRNTWGVLRAPAMTTEPLCSMVFMPKRPGASGSGQVWVKPEYFLQLKVRPWGTTQEQLVQFDFTCSFLVPGKTR